MTLECTVVLSGHLTPIQRKRTEGVLRGYGGEVEPDIWRVYWSPAERDRAMAILGSTARVAEERKL